MDNRSVDEIRKKQLELLEQEKDDITRLYEQSQQIILQLQEKIEDLESPLKPHLIKLDMQNKQVDMHF